MMQLERMLVDQRRPAASASMGSGSPHPFVSTMFSSPSSAPSSSSSSSSSSHSFARPNIQELETARVPTPGAKARVHEPRGDAIDSAFVRQFIKERRGNTKDFFNLGHVASSVAAPFVLRVSFSCALPTNLPLLSLHRLQIDLLFSHAENQAVVRNWLQDLRANGANANENLALTGKHERIDVGDDHSFGNADRLLAKHLQSIHKNARAHKEQQQNGCEIFVSYSGNIALCHT